MINLYLFAWMGLAVAVVGAYLWLKPRKAAQKSPKSMKHELPKRTH